jgi:hypothetical protein
MIEPRLPELSVSQIAGLIDRSMTASTEAVRRGSAAVRRDNWSLVDLEFDRITNVIDRKTVESFTTKPDRTYEIQNFCRLDGAAFIDAAYKGLLERIPDAAGRAFFLEQLRTGTAKIDILGRIRYSSEGRRVGVRLLGLTWRYRLLQATRAPVLGNVIALFLELMSIRRHGARLRRLEYQQWELATKQAETLSAFAQVTDRNFERIDALLNSKL